MRKQGKNFLKIACISLSVAVLGYWVPECGYVLNMLHSILKQDSWFFNSLMDNRIDVCNLWFGLKQFTEWRAGYWILISK